MNNDTNQNNNQMNGVVNTTPVEQPINVPQNNPVPPQNNNSSNKNFIITIIVVVILVALASGGAVYFITSSRNNNNQTNQENNNGSSNQNNNEQQNKPTPATLSDEELDKYLSYIPMGDVSLTGGGIKSAYEMEKTTVNDYSKKVLVHMALMAAYDLGFPLDLKTISCGNECPELNYGDTYDAYTDLTQVNKVLHYMYNLDLNNIDLNILNEGSQLSAGGEAYGYYNNVIVRRESIGGKAGFSVLDKYEANTDELIIYSYKEFHSMGLDTIYDAYTNKEFTTDGDYETYIKNHKNEFTQYKSVFKKNDTGYYWYSTEVVK